MADWDVTSSRFRAAALALSLVASIPRLPAGAQAADSDAITIGTRHVVQSARLGAARTVFVSLPDEYHRDSAARFPVLVLLDADDHFRGTVAIARYFAGRTEVPGLIVLGVSNRGGVRTRDFMPRATNADSTRFPMAGGVDAFVAFVVDELLPWADGRWRTAPLRVFAGHSFGGIAALHAAVTRPEAFRVTIAMSPSLWWSDAALARDYAARLVADPRPRTVVVTSGGAEDYIHVPTTRFAALVSARRPPDLAFRHLHFPAEGHTTTAFVSLIDALRVAFAPLKAPR